MGAAILFISHFFIFTLSFQILLKQDLNGSERYQNQYVKLNTYF